MLVYAENLVIAKDKRTSKKGNVYGVITVIDNTTPTQTINCLVEDLTLFEKIEPLTKCNMTLDVGFGKYRNVVLKDIA